MFDWHLYLQLDLDTDQHFPRVISPKFCALQVEGMKPRISQILAYFQDLQDIYWFILSPPTIQQLLVNLHFLVLEPPSLQFNLYFSWLNSVFCDYINICLVQSQFLVG